MQYVCEDPNDALQRRMHEDMDTCAFTHFGMLEKTGAIDAPRASRPDEPPAAPRAVAEERAPSEGAPARGTEPPYALLALAAVAVVAGALYYLRRKGRAAAG